jgi:hypothetical protein
MASWLTGAIPLGRGRRVRRSLAVARHLLRSLAVGTVVSCAVLPVMASAASSPIDANEVIHGCWTNIGVNGSHALVLQDAGTSCPPGTTAISWNQTGPAGAVGPRGPAGAAGPTGPAGATGPAGPAGPAGPPGPAGPTGSIGPSGPAGANGHTVLSGTGAPSGVFGNDGDFYIDTSAEVLYGPKANGVWPGPGVSLIGAPGTPGAAGAAGPAGPPGPPGTLSGIDALSGTACNIGTPYQGTLSVSYSGLGSLLTDPLSLACNVPGYQLNVAVFSFNGPGHCVLGSCTYYSGTGTVTSSPGIINCGTNGTATFGTCSSVFAPGTIVTLTASPGPGSLLNRWEGACSPSGLTCTLVMTGSQDVNADFVGT